MNLHEIFPFHFSHGLCSGTFGDSWLAGYCVYIFFYVWRTACLLSLAFQTGDSQQWTGLSVCFFFSLILPKSTERVIHHYSRGKTGWEKGIKTVCLGFIPACISLRRMEIQAIHMSLKCNYRGCKTNVVHYCSTENVTVIWIRLRLGCSYNVLK